MSDNIYVPIQVIEFGLTDKYVKLKRAEEDCENKLWKICETQEKLVGDTLKKLDVLRHSFVKYTYDYKKFQERKEWLESLTVQSMSNEIVETQGLIQELMARQVGINEELKDLNKQCGI